MYSLGLGTSFICNLSTGVGVQEIDNLNVSLDILNDDYIVKKDWLESLILDVFPFENEKLIDTYNKILSEDFNLMDNGKINFDKLNYISDFVLF